MAVTSRRTDYPKNFRRVKAGRARLCPIVTPASSTAVLFGETDMKKETKAEILPFVFPELEWMLADDRFTDAWIRQANTDIQFHWRHHVLDCKTKTDAMVVGLALLQVLEFHRSELRSAARGRQVLILNELEELLPYNRWKLFHLKEMIDVEQKYRPEIIPIEQFYAEA